ncbi:MAG: TIGR03546 family protein [Gammaproteobacteria bacterium]|nr:TIGR03546 family protein [Gammaproteobacteria bacterium]
MITQIFKILRVLASEDSPMQISIAIALAMVMGLTPLFSLHNLLVLIILLAFRINLGAFLLAWAFFSGLAYLLDPLFHSLGQFILQHPAMQDTWTEMYNSTYWRLANFNNTIVMGSFVTAMLAFIPMLLILNFLIRRYRSHVLVFLKKSRLVTWMQSSKMITRITSAME